MSVSVAHGELVVEVLGAGSGHPTATRDTSSLLIGSAEGWTAVECPGSIVHKLEARGLTMGSLYRLILTHKHIDHVYGFPHLVHAMAIEGQRKEIHLFAPAETLAIVEEIVAVHELVDDWYPVIRCTEIPVTEPGEILSLSGLRITTTGVAHTCDTVALRFETEAAAICYSSDTRPCAAVTRLATGADILLHDCGGPHRLRSAFSAGHSSALEAGNVATDAGVGKLVLMHLGARDEATLKECQLEAQTAFGGPVDLAMDGMRWVFPGRWQM
jgi:ribonuclease Z